MFFLIFHTNSSAISPETIPEFIQQFLRSSSSLRVSPRFPSEFLREFFQSWLGHSPKNMFIVPPAILTEFLRQFFEVFPGFSSVVLKKFLQEYFQNFCRELLRSPTGYSFGFPPRKSSKNCLEFVHKFLRVPSGIPLNMLQKFLQSSSNIRHPKFLQFSRKYSSSKSFGVPAGII